MSNYGYVRIAPVFFFKYSFLGYIKDKYVEI